MKILISELQDYLYDHYINGGIDQSLFMKLVEEMGEVAEILNKRQEGNLLVMKILSLNWEMS